MTDDKRHTETTYRERKRWLDEPRNVNKIWYGLIVACALLFVADFFVEKHPYFGIEKIPNFYGIYGFVGCVFLVLAAAQLRKILMRPENYYIRREARGERALLGDTSGEPDAPDTPIVGHLHDAHAEGHGGGR